MRLPPMWSRIEKRSPEECWPWTGPKDRLGYPQHGGRTSPHRVVLVEKLGRSLLPGLFACHLCDNPSCCNPAHLYEGSPKQNVADMIARGHARGGPPKGGGLAGVKPACPQGHPYAGDNLLIDPKGYRRCRACKNGWVEVRDIPLRKYPGKRI